jgi:hypothetical protein
MKGVRPSSAQGSVWKIILLCGTKLRINQRSVQPSKDGLPLRNIGSRKKTALLMSPF